MKAITGSSYGPLDALERREIGVPAPGPGEVLVRVRAAAVHVGDVFAVEGHPFPVRFVTGLRRPRYGVPGLDVAGTVDAVGPQVTRFAVGDEVFGSGIGTAAEFARARERELAPKPATLSFEEAAAIPTSALAALHGLRDAAKLTAGQRVLINGASGGVGTFAIQIAKAMGAHVTGVTSTRNVGLVRELGADAVIDYTAEDCTKQPATFDVVLDNIENRRVDELRRVLAPRGVLVLNSGTGAGGLRMLLRLVTPLVRSVFSRQKMRRYLSTPNHADLVVLAELVEAGKLRPVIDRTFPLDETVAALRHVQGGHARGKVVLAV